MCELKHKNYINSQKCNFLAKVFQLTLKNVLMFIFNIFVTEASCHL